MPGGPPDQSLKLYLHSVLSVQGPQAVPYTDGQKYQIENQLTELQQVFPTLAIRLSDFHANDGRLLHLLKADGTIPIHYQGSKYNIPVVVWLTARFPEEPPLAYVVPTTTMVIKAGHPYVDRNGQVSCSCLRKWSSRSNLVELCLEMSQLFGTDPPLYSQPAGAAAAAAAAAATRPTSQPLPTTQPPPGYPAFPGLSQPSYPTAYSGSSVSSSTGPGSALSNRPAGSYSGPQAYPPVGPQASALAAANPLWGPAFTSMTQQTGARPPGYTNPPPPGMGSGLPTMQSDPSASTMYGGYGGQPPAPGGYGAAPYGAGRPPPPPAPAPPRVTAAELHANFRPLALRALTLHVETASKAWAEHASEQTNALLEDQRLLTEHRAQLQRVVNALKAEREGTEGLVSEMGSKQAQLVAWLERNEPKAAAFRQTLLAGETPDFHKIILPIDDLTKQAMETQAEDLACEDAMLALDKALQAGLSGLTHDVYLRQVRALCRKQFYARALGLKVAGLQRQQPPPPPTRSGPGTGIGRAYPVSHGDSWMHPADAARVAMGGG